MSTKTLLRLISDSLHTLRVLTTRIPLAGDASADIPPLLRSIANYVVNAEAELDAYDSYLQDKLDQKLAIITSKRKLNTAKKR